MPTDEVSQEEMREQEEKGETWGWGGGGKHLVRKAWEPFDHHSVDPAPIIAQKRCP